MDLHWVRILLILPLLHLCYCQKVLQVPSFGKLKLNYPGHKHYGGHFSHRKLKVMIGYNESLPFHDTSALRLSHALNKIGGNHSLGRNLIRLSTSGKDSFTGRSGLQYIYNPIAFGPYFADKYGYPSVSVLHETDPIATKKRFYGKQGILEIITYTKKGNLPKGHIALWDCDHVHQAKDWISKHHLITVQFWQSPDYSCPFESKSKLKPVPFDEPRVDTIRYLAARLQKQKLLTLNKNGKTYKKIVFSNEVL